MCLSEIGRKKIAKEDIICYKSLSLSVTLSPSVKDGDDFKGVINTIECEGKISVGENGNFFLCTNNPPLDGLKTEDKKGYAYSWTMDDRVTECIVNGENVIIDCLVTPYKDARVEMGKTYTSEIIKSGGGTIIGKALHSFCKLDAYKLQRAEIIAECIIPKGSVYYKGMFDYDESYASDKLTYVKLLKS